MWQICSHIPQSLLAHQDLTCMAAQLSVSFFTETFIHAKEKVNWRHNVETSESKYLILYNFSQQWYCGWSY